MTDTAGSCNKPDCNHLGNSLLPTCSCFPRVVAQQFVTLYGSNIVCKISSMLVSGVSGSNKKGTSASIINGKCFLLLRRRLLEYNLYSPGNTSCITIRWHKNPVYLFSCNCGLQQLGPTLDSLTRRTDMHCYIGDYFSFLLLSQVARDVKERCTISIDS